jgi:methanogenic corrinoid protein MtbC1
MAGLRNAGFRSVRHGDVVPRDDVIEAPKQKKEAKTDLVVPTGFTCEY